MKMEEIRAELAQIADDLQAAGRPMVAHRIRFLAEATKRRFFGRNTNRHTSWPPLTDAQADMARVLYDAGSTYDEIAARFHTNGGRVSEALRGFRV